MIWFCSDLRHFVSFIFFPTTCTSSQSSMVNLHLQCKAPWNVLRLYAGMWLPDHSCLDFLVGTLHFLQAFPRLSRRVLDASPIHVHRVLYALQFPRGHRVVLRCPLDGAAALGLNLRVKALEVRHRRGALMEDDSARYGNLMIKQVRDKTNRAIEKYIKFSSSHSSFSSWLHSKINFDREILMFTDHWIERKGNKLNNISCL